MKIDFKKVSLWVVLYFVYLLYILIIQNFIIPKIGSLHAGNGILIGDNELFYKYAIKMANEIRSYGLEKWQLFPDNSAGINASLASLFFLFFGDHISVLAPWNCFLHIVSAYALYQCVRELNFSPKSSIFGILCFIFFPTTLIWVSQLHKDLYSTLGWFFFFWALILIQKEKSLTLSGILITFSSILLLLVRPLYLNLLFVTFIFSFIFNIASKTTYKMLKNKLLFYFVGLIPIVLGIVFFYTVGIKNTENEIEIMHALEKSISSESTTSTCNPTLWESNKYIPNLIDKKLESLAFTRKRQICFMPNSAKSNTQLDFFPNSSNDILMSLPHTIFTALVEISPFKIYSIGSLQAYSVLPEMVIYYFFLIVLLVAIVRHPNKNIITVSLIAILVMIILAITTPNLGTLHRVRFPFFIVLISLGSAYFFTPHKEEISNPCQEK